MIPRALDAPAPTQPKLPPDFSQQIGFSDFVIGGRVDYQDVIEEIYEQINREYGTNVRPPGR